MSHHVTSITYIKHLLNKKSELKASRRKSNSSTKREPYSSTRAGSWATTNHNQPFQMTRSLVEFVFRTLWYIFQKFERCWSRYHQRRWLLKNHCGLVLYLEFLWWMANGQPWNLKSVEFSEARASVLRPNHFWTHADTKRRMYLEGQRQLGMNSFSLKTLRSGAKYLLTHTSTMLHFFW